jgi:hypothetical protein
VTVRRVCLFGDATGLPHEANTFLCQLHGGTPTLSKTVMSTCTPVRSPPLHGTIGPLTRFPLLRRMTGSLMSSLGGSFSDSAFPTPLRYGSSFPEYLRRVDVSSIYKSTMPFRCVCCVTPKHYRIISKGSSEGFSPWFLLLGSTSSASGMLNMCVSVSPLVATMRRHPYFHAQDCYAASCNSMLSRLCE